MLKNLFHYLWEKKFLQYSIVGSSAFVFDFASLVVFKEIFNLDPIMAVALNQILIINYVFFLNKYWSFKSDGQTVKQMIILWMWLFTQLISFTLEVNLFGGTRDLWYLVVRLVNILLAVSWNFLLYKYWVYRKVY